MKQDPCPASAEVAKPTGIGFDPSGNTMAMINAELATTTARLAAPGNAMQLGIIPQRIATLWEVKTAKLQTNIGDPSAGLTEEERAAKAGLLGFGWHGKGFLKPTDWIDKEDGFLMLDRDASGYVTTGNDLLSNPMIADPGKGLRILAAYDSNGDGIIDARDPVYGALKVWRDLDQDCNNVTPITVGTGASAVITASQDQTDGQLELRSLADMGITAIDYNNSRYVYAGGYGSAKTLTLGAEDVGVRHTGAGAGILIQLSNGSPRIEVQQPLSEVAVYAPQQIVAGGETLGSDGKGLCILATQVLHECYEIHSEIHNKYGGWVEILHSRSARRAVNDLNWRMAA